MEHVKKKATCADDAIDRLEQHFLGLRARRVKEEVWEALTFEFVKQSYAYKIESITNEAILNSLMEQVTELANIRMSPRTDEVVSGKIIAAVKKTDTFKVVYENPPRDLE